MTLLGIMLSMLRGKHGKGDLNLQMSQLQKKILRKAV